MRLAQPPGERHAARAQPDEHEVARAAVALQDLVRHARDRPAHLILVVEQLLLLGGILAHTAHPLESVGQKKTSTSISIGWSEGEI